jgi:superfamily II DNA or RNA helicase
MIQYNKRKGIIYVNNTSNAENLYKLMKKQDKISTYIYVSKDIETIDDLDKDIEAFENNLNQSIIIVVGKLGYGYDNSDIDFICLGDPRQSAIDIRQIIGRGIRWNRNNYPNKLLHLLVPLYKDEFNTYKNNKNLKKYLDYIIGECGQDIILKNGKIYVGDGDKINNFYGLDYDGDNIPLELLEEYCTTGYNKFTDFERFLKVNKIYNEETYNELQEKQKWMVPLCDIHKKYPKFCFRNIDPNRNLYYETKEEAKINYNENENKLINNIGKDKVRRLNFQQKIKKINDIYDIKIPSINFDLYYGIY